MSRTISTLSTLLVLASLVSLGCSEDAEVLPADDGELNPFTDPALNSGKADTHYLNPDGIEVEVDIEADIDAPAWRKAMAPAILGQFAMTHLRTRGELYLESVAEDATSKDRVEWLVDGSWLTAADAASVDGDKLTHFRIRGMNAVLLLQHQDKAQEGATFEVPVPKRPFSIFADAGDTCAKYNSHITLGQSIYWYMWHPTKSGCNADLQTMTVTVSKVLPAKETTYPEYDKLIEDGKVTAVVIFGQIGDELNEWDTGVRNFERMSRWLRDGGFVEAAEAPVGRRFNKLISGVDFEVDLYSPYEFKGLSDTQNLPNFLKGLEEHEIVVYDGHSMLGASDFWTKPNYPETYQIFIYGGCLGYEYYVQPILKSKVGGWDNVDIVSSVIEVSVGATVFAAPALAKIAWALENNYDASWKDLLIAIRNKVGDSTFGASGVNDNCFTPTGSRCTGEPVEPETKPLHVEDTEATKIPDGDAAGIEKTLEVEGEGTVDEVTITLKVTHGWASDVVARLVHGDTSVTVYESDEQDVQDIDHTVTLADFRGMDAAGQWTLQILDKMTPDGGTLESWSLDITLQAAPTE